MSEPAATPRVTGHREITVIVTIPGFDDRIVRVPVEMSDDYSTVSGSFMLTPDEARVLATAPPMTSTRRTACPK
jgi:hypothetical protein